MTINRESFHYFEKLNPAIQNLIIVHTYKTNPDFLLEEDEKHEAYYAELRQNLLENKPLTEDPELADHVFSVVEELDESLELYLERFPIPWLEQRALSETNPFQKYEELNRRLAVAYDDPNLFAVLLTECPEEHELERDRAVIEVIKKSLIETGTLTIKGEGSLSVSERGIRSIVQALEEWQAENSKAVPSEIPHNAGEGDAFDFPLPDAEKLKPQKDKFDVILSGLRLTDAQFLTILQALPIEKITLLDLTNNFLSAISTVILADKILASKRRMWKVNLSNNPIGDMGARAFKKCFPFNLDKILNLTLKETHLSEEGKKELKEARIQTATVLQF